MIKWSVVQSRRQLIKQASKSHHQGGARHFGAQSTQNDKQK